MAALEQVSSYQGHPFFRAHFKMCKCPCAAALAHVPESHEYPLSRHHFNTSILPLAAAAAQMFSCITGQQSSIYRSDARLSSTHCSIGRLPFLRVSVVESSVEAVTKSNKTTVGVKSYFNLIVRFPFLFPHYSTFHSSGHPLPPLPLSFLSLHISSFALLSIHYARLPFLS
jgi:hypothetical protein